VRSTVAIAARGALCLSALGLTLASCRGVRASSIPLGGSHEEDVVVAKAAAPAASATPAAKPTEPDEVVDTVAPKGSEPAAAEPVKETGKALVGAFQVKPYVARQTWTRLFDMQFDLKVGPGGSIDMKMVSHQEARFEVLGVTAGVIDKLGIEYSVYTSAMTIMGATQDSPEELAGKRFVVTFARGVPSVRDASGNTPPKKQVDSVKDDAREPLEIETALKELAQLAAKGRGDFSFAGAVALAGGEDDDTKVPKAKASLQKLTTGAHNDKLALVDMGYTLTNAVDDKSTIEVSVAGSLSVLDAPARYQTSTLQGPMELRSSEAGGMQGRGTIKVTTTYKY
jgi:hypothetical protein